ncbi:MAG: RNA chaperone Hfq [Gammaproteobacteria bacterium]|jgi:host factor-I protein
MENTKSNTKSNNESLQDAFLNRCSSENIPVDIFLVSGIRLKGTIQSFDQYAIFLKNDHDQMIFKHQISTIMPHK